VHYYFAMTRYPTKELYRQAWADAHHTDPAVPLNVDIELASLCNLACPFCFWGEADFNTQMLAPAADGKAKKRLMPTELALRIIDEAAEIGVPALKFNWRGESTIHPDYSSILKYARALYRNGSRGDGGISKLSRPAFHELLVNTNANCKDHAIEGLMAATKVMVSLDSTVPETYKVMRVNGSLDRATEVIRELIRRGHPNLWVRRVITTANQAEPFAQRVRDLFGPTVHMSASTPVLTGTWTSITRPWTPSVLSAPIAGIRASASWWPPTGTATHAASIMTGPWPWAIPTSRASWIYGAVRTSGV
jgi:hypothetical protein